MDNRYFERMHVAEARRRDRQMVFAALRARGKPFGRRGIVQSIFWLLGLR